MCTPVMCACDCTESIVFDLEQAFEELSWKFHDKKLDRKIAFGYNACLREALAAAADSCQVLQYTAHILTQEVRSLAHTHTHMCVHAHAHICAHCMYVRTHNTSLSVQRI